MFIFRFFFKLIWRFLFLALLFLLIWIFLTVNERNRETVPETFLIPPSRPILDPNAMADAVFIDKSERRLQLLHQGQLLREYTIALGFSPEGQKQVEGDGKTPTGEYTLDWRNAQSSFYRSLHISYPRPDQIETAKSEGRNPGGMIMIHGQPNKSPLKGDMKISADWTAGCIAVSNAEMDEIWDRVQDGTKITIVE